MKSVSVSGSPRENVGKKDAKNLRRQGLVPCVLYGGKEQVSFSMAELAFKDIIFTPESCLVKLDIDGKVYDVILQDAQFHPVTGKVIHCDFLQVFPDKLIKIDIPINVVGISPGVIKGGKLITKLRKLRVKGLMDALPDNIEINISKLNINDSVKINQVNVKGLEFLDPANAVVIIVKMTRGAGMGEEETDEAEETEGTEGAEGGEGAEGSEEKSE
ncbi:MAG: 50S ribosomal protein L25/general stress protein Ctc [Bacteroidetes bacterium]|nr:MAG: 50S ribosomal protein L25/general stress protein Ctc [Bacteroidota bacterium]